MRKPYQIIIISIITGILVISCNLTSSFPGISKNVPTSTTIPVVVPEQIFIEPTIIVSTDSVTVTFTEADVLSWIQQYQSSGATIILADPVVKLDDGLAQISGNVESEFITGAMLIQFSVMVSTDGTPIVTIVRMQIGEMDLPDSMKTQFSALINQSISESMVGELGGRSIQSINIDNGLMTIQTSN
jgi:hypothetical protein